MGKNPQITALTAVLAPVLGGMVSHQAVPMLWEGACALRDRAGCLGNPKNVVIRTTPTRWWETHVAVVSQALFFCRLCTDIRSARWI